MKLFSLVLTLAISFVFNFHQLSAKDAIIIGHDCAKLGDIPENWIAKAKTDFRIAYGHTSHGSQLVTGMGLLRSENSLFSFNQGDGSLELKDATPSGDLGNPDRTTWAERTRTLLQQSGNKTNMIMWSWCGQVDGSETDINTYLTLMDGLENEFPDITFVYMTGHLNGSGEQGNVNKRNEQIRKFCRDNGKVLFDFADIESYDPDGKYFLDKNADDGCNYDGGNWADEWCEAHPGECDDCGCAHSKCINCQQKGKAFWHMMARLAGWNGTQAVEELNNTESAQLFQPYPNPALGSVTIVFYLPEDMSISISLYSIEGNLIKKLISDELFSGKIKHEYKFDTKDMATGAYEVRLNSGNLSLTQKIAIVK